MSRQSTRTKRRTLLSRRMGCRWSGHGRVNRLETPSQFGLRVALTPYRPGEVFTFQSVYLTNEKEHP